MNINSIKRTGSYTLPDLKFSGVPSEGAESSRLYNCYNDSGNLVGQLRIQENGEAWRRAYKGEQGQPWAEWEKVTE